MIRPESFYTDENGATPIEYGIVCALIAIVVVASVSLLDNPIDALFGSVAEHFKAIEF